jgi:SAM-dependent methyltransferase
MLAGLTEQSSRILVAGAGTGLEPLYWAQIAPHAQVTALDLSAASLAYGVQKAQVMKVHNIRFVRADILELRDNPERFDLILATGVLHHLSDPVRGWAVLRDLLSPGGVMKIALYSTVARAGFAQARDLIEKSGRAALGELPLDHPARVVLRTSDFFNANGYRDLLYHPREKSFTPPEVQEMLGRLGLHFVKMELPSDVLLRFRTLFPEPEDERNLQLWGAFEQMFPSTFLHMMTFWCRQQEPDLEHSKMHQ